MNRSSPCDCGGCESCAPDYHDPEPYPGEDPYERAAVMGPLPASPLPVDPDPKE